jgi:hypothetical protein
MRRAHLAALIVVAAAAVGCSPKMIPNSEIRDTEENRQILSVIAAYKNALEGRNVERIMSLVSESFFETSGTPDGEDDYDYEGLQNRLKEWAERTRSIRAELKVRSIEVEGDQARARYFYDINYQIPGPEGVPQWKRESDTKEMHLQREGSVWRITSGI